MATIKNVKLFGGDERGFLNAIKHYSDIKVGYDGTISSYGSAYTVRQLAVVDDKGIAVKVGTVPIRNQISYKNDIEPQIPVIDGVEQPIGFGFFIPLKKGFQVSVHAELTSWDGSEVLAKVENIIGAYVEPGDTRNKPDDLFVKANAEDYAYVPILLSSLPGEDLGSANNYLQAKIKRWRNKKMDISRQLFVFRVWQLVWPVDMKMADVESKNFEVRDDSLILEIKD